MTRTGRFLVMTWRVGLVGYGWAAGAHLAALEKVADVEVVAICTSRTDVDADTVAADHGRPIQVVRDLDGLLARPDIDVVDLCSRSDLHAAQAVAAARAGKHLIIEKPIALDVLELTMLTKAVAESGVKTCVCFNIRFSPQFAATRSLLEGDRIGPLHYAEVDYYHEVGPIDRAVRVELAPGRWWKQPPFGGLPLCRCPSCGHGLARGGGQQLHE